MLVALVTISVAISSPLLTITIKQFCFTREKTTTEKHSVMHTKKVYEFEFLALNILPVHVACVMPLCNRKYRENTDRSVLYVAVHFSTTYIII